jgi:hypothetical protein
MQLDPQAPRRIPQNNLFNVCRPITVNDTYPRANDRFGPMLKFGMLYAGNWAKAIKLGPPRHIQNGLCNFFWSSGQPFLANKGMGPKHTSFSF